MKSSIIITIILIALVILNPSLDNHKRKVNQKCKELNPITGLIGGCGLFSKLGLEYHDWGICSYTVYTISDSENKRRPVTIGVLGMVVIVQDLNI